MTKSTISDTSTVSAEHFLDTLQVSRENFLFFWKLFLKQNQHSCAIPSQLPMTEGSAIRIDVHSAEVVHFTHKIRFIRRDQPRIVIHKYAGFG